MPTRFTVSYSYYWLRLELNVFCLYSFIIYKFLSHIFILFYSIFSEAKEKENINKNDSLSYLERNLIWRFTDDLQF